MFSNSKSGEKRRHPPVESIESNLDEDLDHHGHDQEVIGSLCNPTYGLQKEYDHCLTFNAFTSHGGREDFRFLAKCDYCRGSSFIEAEIRRCNGLTSQSPLLDLDISAISGHYCNINWEKGSS